MAMRTPRGACDCHMHVYDCRFPAMPGAQLTPPDALVADYQRLQARLGLERTVVVTPSTYGTDNASLRDALSQLGPHARGVAVVNGSVSDAELQTLHASGVRGIRFNQTISDVTPLDALEPLAERIAPLGWHIQLLLRADDLATLEPRLQRLAVPVVFDHLGRLPAPAMRHPGYAVIRRLLDEGRAWVKLSGAYLGSVLADGRYPDADLLARSFLAAAPRRVVWGSNWPHPTASAGRHARPDDVALLELLAHWVDDEQLFTRVLADNPAALYGFPLPH